MSGYGIQQTLWRRQRILLISCPETTTIPPPTHEILNPMLGIDIQAISIFVDLAMSNPQQMCPHNFIGPQIFHLLIDNAPIMDVPKLF